MKEKRLGCAFMAKPTGISKTKQREFSAMMQCFRSLCLSVGSFACRQGLIHWSYGCRLWFLVFGVHEMEMRSLIALAIVNWATNAVLPRIVSNPDDFFEGSRISDI
jgi:hypothetical protein